MKMIRYTNKNPLTGRFQYEYALYQVVSGMFASAKPKSRRIDSLKLYFRELPLKQSDEANKTGKKKRSQEDVLDEMRALAARDVVGHINFPMLNECRVEVLTKEESSGANNFIYTDGVYCFMLHLEMAWNGHPKRIKVRNRTLNTEDLGKKKQKKKAAALKGAA